MSRLKQITKGQRLSQGYRVYSTDGVACTLQGMSGGVGAKTGLYMVKVKDATAKGYSEIGVGGGDVGGIP